MHRRALVSFAVLSLIVGAIVTYLWRNASVNAIEADTLSTDMAPTTEQAAVSFEAEGDTREPAHQGCRILVFSGSSPVAKARCFFVRNEQRSYCEPRLLGTTNTHGSLVVEQSLHATGSVLVIARGHVPAKRKITSNATTIHIQLEAGSEATITVISSTGQLLTNARVAVSQASLSMHAFGQELHEIPGSGPIGLHEKRTNDKGRATFSQLLVGRFSIAVSLPGYVQTTGFEPLMVPGKATVTMTPMLGAAVQISGDEVLDYHPMIRVPSVTGILLDTLERQRRGLASKFPTCFVVVAAPRNKARREALLRVYLRHSGWKTLRVALLPVSDIKSPTVLDVAKGKSDKTGVAILFVEDRQRHRVNGIGLHLTPLGPSSASMGIDSTIGCRSGKAQRIPAGEYSVSIVGRLMRVSDIGRVHIRPGCETERTLSLDYNLRKVEIRCHKGGVRIRAGYIQVVDPTGHRSFPRVAGVLSPLYLPTGKLTISPVITGFVATSSVVDVQAGEGIQRIEVPLKVAH